jgi:HSP20 family molecular chaperone IbpA
MAEIEQELRDEIGEALRIAGEPQSVPVNLYRTDEALVLVAPLPGVMADDVEVVVEPGAVTVSAVMRTAAPKDYLLHEWHYGPYRRTVEIPGGFGATAAASFGNGQIAVHLGRGDPTERFVVHPGNGGRR